MVLSIVLYKMLYPFISLWMNPEARHSIESSGAPNGSCGWNICSEDVLQIENSQLIILKNWSFLWLNCASNFRNILVAFSLGES